MKTIAIIQARLTSSRFPHKVLAKIQGKTMLQHVIDRVNKAKEVDEVVVASPHKIPFKRAKSFIWSSMDEKNVLARYYYCALKYYADIIVRITSDCPLINSEDIDTLTRRFKKSQWRYIKYALIDGLDIEVFSFNILNEAYFNTCNSYDLEHVTPYMKRATKLSVDTKEDLEKVKKWIKSGKELYL